MINLNIIQFYSVNNPCYKSNVNKADSRYTSFQTNGPKGLMLHSVGCSQPSAKVFATGWNKSNKETLVQAVLQADGTVYQLTPWNYRTWHCGGDANNTHVGVEMTEPSQIKYVSGTKFTCNDLSAARAQVAGTYNTAIELFAYLCKIYELDPLKKGVIISHYEGSALGIASGHADPEHLWKGLDLPYTMDTFRKAVKNKIEEDEEMRYEKLKDITNKYYRPVVDKLMAQGILKGKSGTGEDTVIDLSEDSVRLLVILDRAGVFEK